MLTDADLVTLRPLVRATVRAFGRRARHLSMEELEQICWTAAVAHAPRFDPSRGTTLKTFLAPRLHGALIDHLRLDAWPRGFRARARALHEYVDQRTHSGDSRTPTDAELCATLAWTPEQLRTYRFQEQVHQHRVDPFAGTQPATPEQQYATRERRRIVLRAIRALPPNERHIILERFYADRRHADIATDLHVNESRVSQLYQRALGRLRSTLSAA